MEGISNKKSSLFSYEVLVHALSGATASVVAMGTFYPLDTVRSRIQLEDPEKHKASDTVTEIKKLVQNEGYATLYRGMVPVLQSLCASNFVYFYTFHGLKFLQNSSQQTAIKDLLLGMIAGACNVMVTTPLWVVNTRLKMKGVDGSNSNYNGLLDGLLQISRDEGLAGLWAGAIPSLILVINPAIQFMTYEGIKRRLLLRHKNVPSTTYFALGALSKIIATCLTYPLQLVQTKLRHGKKPINSIEESKMGVMQMLQRLLRQQGIRGLYRGLEAKLLQTVFTVALMFVVYEKITKFVLRLLLRSGQHNAFKRI